MTDVRVLIVVAATFVIVVAIAVTVANDRGYNRGFKDGMWFRKMSEGVSWETALDAIVEDLDD